MKNILTIAIVLMGVLQFSCEKKKKIIFHKSHELKKENAPFSDAVEIDNLLFLSGQIGMDHSTRTLVEGGIEAETLQTIKNIEAVLQHHNLGLENVIKCTVILSDINDFATFNEIYIQHFKQKPARTTFAASGLAANASIEIEVVAYR